MRQIPSSVPAFVCAPVSDGNPPASIDSHHAQEDADGGAKEHWIERLCVERLPDADNPRCGERSHRVEVGAKDARNIARQDIAHDPSTDPGHHAEHGSHHRVDAIVKRFLRARNREHGETDGVEDARLSPL